MCLGLSLYDSNRSDGAVTLSHLFEDKRNLDQSTIGDIKQKIDTLKKQHMNRKTARIERKLPHIRSVTRIETDNEPLYSINDNKSKTLIKLQSIKKENMDLNNRLVKSVSDPR